MKSILCIDPSIRSLGWAVFNLYEDYGVLVNVGYIKDTKRDWIYRVDAFVNELYDLFADRSLNLILIEQPCVYHTGSGAVASNAESIMKLSSFVFAVRQMFLDYCDAEIKLITPRRWKGTCPKIITKKRISKHWKFESDNDDIIDATGIGDFWIRKKLKIKDLRNEIP